MDCKNINKAGKLDNAIQEMYSMNLDIMGISETRWTESAKFVTGNHTMIYFGGIKHKNGVGFILNKKVANAVMGYFFFYIKIKNLQISFTFHCTIHSEERL